MKKWTLFLGALLIFCVARAQPAGLASRIGPQPAISPSSGFFVDYTDGRPIMANADKDAEGSFFWAEEWCSGKVLLHKNRIASGLSLKFNIYNQELYFNRNNAEMAFADSVKEFEITCMVEGLPRYGYFRNGYPAIDRFTAQTYYEVLTDSSFQLLRSYRKELVEVEEINRPKKKVIRDFSEYYVYTPSGKMVRIKADAKKIIEALPEYATQINRLLEQNKLKLKKEEDLVRLFKMMSGDVKY
ncbi:MAG: hypothetical protein IPG86_18485 [Chitinophagaceae bacterium]|nr:hypothetical protein [Chitinophagaceae bacterium]